MYEKVFGELHYLSDMLKDKFLYQDSTIRGVIYPREHMIAVCYEPDTEELLNFDIVQLITFGIKFEATTDTEVKPYTNHEIPLTLPMALVNGQLMMLVKHEANIKPLNGKKFYFLGVTTEDEAHETNWVEHLLNCSTELNFNLTGEPKGESGSKKEGENTEEKDW